MSTIGVWLLAILATLNGLYGDRGYAASFRDCGDSPPPCATTDDGPAGNGWYLIIGAAHLRVPAPDRGHRDEQGVQWWVWSPVPATED